MEILEVLSALEALGVDYTTTEKDGVVAIDIPEQQLSFVA